MSDVLPALEIANSQYLVAPPPAECDWSYDEAFQRNRGLISEQEQATLRASRVAIAGMGGVGGVHLITLARMGIGKFTIADCDTFDVANFNRQEGATVSNVARPKAEVMAERAWEVNPQLDIQVFSDKVGPRNVDRFLDGADIFLDGVDFFSIDARRLLFAEARRRGLWSVTAGPIGFSAAWLAFDPRGMSFDEYFDLTDSQSRLEKLVAFAVGLTPKATHLSYMDLNRVDTGACTAPSLGLACQLASGVAATKVAKILLGRKPLRPAPYYSQFDAHSLRFRHGRLWLANRHPLQRLKRYYLKKRFADRFEE